MFALRSIGNTKPSIGNTKQDGCTTGYLSKCKMTRNKSKQT